MLEYLTHDLGHPITHLLFDTSGIVRKYLLRPDRLHYGYSERRGELTQSTFLTIPRAIALSRSQQGLLLLTKQGYFYSCGSYWAFTLQATVAQFFNPEGREIYKHETLPLTIQPPYCMLLVV